MLTSILGTCILGRRRGSKPILDVIEVPGAKDFVLLWREQNKGLSPLLWNFHTGDFPQISLHKPAAQWRAFLVNWGIHLREGIDTLACPSTETGLYQGSSISRSKCQERFLSILFSEAPHSLIIFYQGSLSLVG